MLETEGSVPAVLENNKHAGLRRESLSFVEVFSQSVANIAPTATPAIAIPFVFASSGTGTWLTFVIATIGLVLVGYSIKQFAAHSATPGSLYSYTLTGLGPNAAFMVGWSLILAYIATGFVVVFGFTLFAADLFKTIGLDLPPIVFFLVDTIAIWFFAYKDIRLSAKVMLIIEFLSVLVILILGAIIIFNKGIVDTSQLTLQGATIDGMRLGLVLAILGYVGFESACSLGVEAQNPTRNVPSAVILSTVFVGIFFVVMSYIEVLGFQGNTTTLDKSGAPLNLLAEAYNVPAFATIISIGAALSFFACGLACVNAVSRILFSMSRDGVIHTSMGQSHSINATPHIAATLSAVLLFLVPTIMILSNISLLDSYVYTGTIATFGFLLAYIMISVAAPIYLRRQKELKISHLVVSGLAVLVMLIPVYGSLIPVPSFPINILPYIYLGYMLIGVAWLFYSRQRNKASQASNS
jgi:amino acid transporter